LAAGLRRLLPGHAARPVDDGRVGGLGDDDGDPPWPPRPPLAAPDPSAAAMVRRQPGGDPHARRGGDPGGGSPALHRARGVVARLVLLAPALSGAAWSLASLFPGAGHHRDVRAAVRERRFALRRLAGILEHPFRIPGATRPLSPRRAHRGGGVAVPIPALASGGADAGAVAARGGTRAP